MKRLKILCIFFLLTSCVNKDITDLYAVEGHCKTKTYYLAEGYKYQPPNEPRNDRVTTYEYVCKDEGVDVAGKDIKTFDELKAIEDAGGKTTRVVFLPESYAKKMGFRHLFRD